jgi:hypothetical protein
MSERRATQDQIFRNVAEWHEDRAARRDLPPRDRERHERCAFGARQAAWEWLQSEILAEGQS